MRFIILFWAICSSVCAEVNLRLNNETKEVLPELKVRARVFESWELMEVFYQGKSVCSVTIIEGRFHFESHPNNPFFVSADWSKKDAFPTINITKNASDDPDFEVNLKREKKLQWRVVSDPLRLIMTDEEIDRQRAMPAEDNLLEETPSN